MRRPILYAAMGAVLALGACEKAKPRHLPVDNMAVTPPMDVPAAPTEGLSKGLPRLKGVPAFSLDRIGDAPDPLNRLPAVTSGDQPMLFAGFAVDAQAKAPAKGVDIVVDDKVWGTTYGAPRGDVAAYFKSAALTNVGYQVTLPAHALAPGPHMAVARVVAADGKGYYQSPNYPFTVK